LKKIDSKSQREAVDSIERLAAECGYTWYKGMHPEEQINTLLTMFTELKMLKKKPLALPAPKEL